MLGSLIGGAAFRFRLYSRSGLPVSMIARILAFSITTNWLGYIALAGGVLAARVVPIPPSWKLDAEGLQLLGFVLLAAVAGYFALCAASRQRTWRFRGQEIRLPSMRLALAQFALSAANWLTIAMLLYVLLGGQAAFPLVLGVLLLSAMASVLTHIP